MSTYVQINEDEAAAVGHLVSSLQRAEEAVKNCEGCVALQRQRLTAAKETLGRALRALGKGDGAPAEVAEVETDGEALKALRLVKQVAEGGR